MTFLRDDSPPNTKGAKPVIPTNTRHPMAIETHRTFQVFRENLTLLQKPTQNSKFEVAQLLHAKQKPFQSFHQLFLARKPGQQLPLVAVLHHNGHLPNTRTRINSLHSSTASFRNKNYKMDTWSSTFLLSSFHFSPTSSSFDKTRQKRTQPTRHTGQN